MRIADFSVQVGPVKLTNDIGAASTDVDRYAGFNRDDPRDLPSLERGLQRTARGVAEHWDAVDEVGGEVMGPVELARPKIVPPPEVRVRNCIQVLTAATGGWINGP